MPRGGCMCWLALLSYEALIRPQAFCTRIRYESDTDTRRYVKDSYLILPVRIQVESGLKQNLIQVTIGSVWV